MKAIIEIDDLTFCTVKISYAFTSQKMKYDSKSHYIPVFLSILSISLGIAFAPSIVARFLSPDHALANDTIDRINSVRLFFIFAGCLTIPISPIGKKISTLIQGREKRIRLIAYTSFFLFSFAAIFYSGSKGFFFLDMSVVFDGGYRISQGQIPYRDFYTPAGPLVFVIQALFFRLFGTNYISYLLHPAIVNALAALLVFRLFYKSIGMFYSYLAGLITLALFYLPFSNPFYDQTAFFFILVSFYILLRRRISISDNSYMEKPRFLTTFLCGILSAITFLSKQNIGFLAILALFVAILIYYRSFLAIVYYVAGNAAVILAFSLFILIFADLRKLLYFFIFVPSMSGRITSVLGSLKDLELCQVTVYLSFIYLIAVSKSDVKKILLPFLTVFLLFLIQLGTRLTSTNPVINYVPFLGIIFGIIILIVKESFGGNVFDMFGGEGRNRTYMINAVPVLVGALLLSMGVSKGISRWMHDNVYLRAKRLSYRCSNPRLFPLKETDEIGANLEKTVDFLKQNTSESDAIFVYPHYLIIYGIVGKISPQPLLWFHEGLTYNVGATSSLLGYSHTQLDREIRDSLERENVKWICLDPDYKENFRGYRGPPFVDNLNNFPLTGDYINSNYELVEEYGDFRILGRNSRDSITSAFHKPELQAPSSEIPDPPLL